MKITICGSMRFAKEMFEIKDLLEELEHRVLIPKDSEMFIQEEEIKNDVQFLIDGNYIQDHFDKIAQSDAILVLNFEKNKIKGYVGGNTLMEIGIAKYEKKKIYLLNEIPNKSDLSYATEIQASEPIVINGDLKKIK